MSRKSTSEPTALLLSFYEGGFQPLTIAAAAPYLREAGFKVVLVDQFIEGLTDDQLEEADYICCSLPLYQSLEAGRTFFPKLRETGLPIILFGQHATLASDVLLENGIGDWVIRGDGEVPLANLLLRLEQNGTSSSGYPEGVCRSGERCRPYVHRGPTFHAPDRSSLPPLSRYRYGLAERFLGGPQIVGNVEASRGCHHACLYCSVFGAYEKKVALIPKEIVLQDIRNCVEQGASHICFTDAEFLNSPVHGLKVVKELHQEFPDLTWDYTARADHLLDCADAVREMVPLGARFVTSAFEFPSERVLNLIDKELGIDDCLRAVELCEQIGLGLNPTFLTFNPWSSLEQIYGLSDFLDKTGLARHVDPLQLETRLYLPKGSPLVGSPAMQGISLVEHEFHYEWTHPDSRVDQIFAKVVPPPKEGEFKRCCIKC
jgi:radical SAM superfamily enzyme YgiQ (UPF0313 family)